MAEGLQLSAFYRILQDLDDLSVACDRLKDRARRSRNATMVALSDRVAATVAAAIVEIEAALDEAEDAAPPLWPT